MNMRQITEFNAMKIEFNAITCKNIYRRNKLPNRKYNFVFGNVVLCVQFLYLAFI